MSGSPFWWPAKQVCIKQPCTQDLSSLPTGIFRSFTASRSLSWHIYLSDFVKTWPLGFRLAPGAARLQASPVPKNVGGLTSWLV